MRLQLALLILTTTLHAQWTIQPSHTTADLRGIHSLGSGVAWASGTHGTILHTTDDGATWQTCTTPPNAEQLDFRAIQAFDAQNAIVMSAGKGDLSRVYQTTDACKSWTILFTNPDPNGFWDNLSVVIDFDTLFILGDPVNGQFKLFSAQIDVETATIEKLGSDWNGHPVAAAPGEAAFAASNSLFAYNVGNGTYSFITGGARSEIIHEEHGISADPTGGTSSNWSRSPLPFENCGSCGAFAIAAGTSDKATKATNVVVVGGDYQKPDSPSKTAAYSNDHGYNFQLAQTPPHGYRSSVAFDAATGTWITVGPNGTDVSTDEGKNWRPLKPSPQDPPDADRNWNALSLPFVVGPHGRIARLNPTALTQK